jgi:oligopeptide transport system permease protein
MAIYKNEEISKKDFRFTHIDERIFDEQFETKPVGYFKDALNRFSKNKASVFAFFILVFIILMAIVGPFLNQYTITYSNASLDYLPPRISLLAKLGIADGQKMYYGVAYSTLENNYDLDSIVWMSEPYQQTTVEGTKETLRTVVDIKVDVYKNRFGYRDIYAFGGDELAELQAETYYVSHVILEEEIFSFVHPVTGELIVTDTSIYRVTISYKDYYYSQLSKQGITFADTSDYPSFWFGTNGAGFDLFTHVWTGARTSLLIGLYVMLITVSVGVVWGSISGYYGGTVDILMERFVEIISGVPWLVTMTLIKMYADAGMRSATPSATAVFFQENPIFLIALALVITSWIGTAGSVRTQFYRYKGREYVLASRTLGAKDRRLIFKHILPNAIGPIITGSVLIIPSAIFTESSIAYLNLGPSGTIISIGTLLSEGQAVLTTAPHMVLFPALIISALMISFNLFGNGLRDAFNPSLRGAE